LTTRHTVGIVLALLCAALVASCSGKSSEDDVPLIFAAASLSDVLTESAEIYEQETGNRVDFSFGGSITLANQITKLGAPADGVLFAGDVPGQIITEAGLELGARAPQTITNQLVVIAKEGSPPINSLSDLTNTNRLIAVADADLAPAGRYAERALESAGLTSANADQLIFTLDVRAALAAVESGNAEFGIVYRTDALTSDNVVTVLEIDDGDVGYFSSGLTGANNSRAAQTFLNFAVLEPETRALFESAGFKFNETSSGRGNPADELPTKRVSSDLSIVALSLQIALIATAVTLPIGMFVAWLLVRKQFRGKFALDVIVSLPLALPPVVIGYVLLWVVGTNGWIGQLSESWFGSTLAFTWIAAALAAAIVSLPLVVRSFTAALAGVDPRLETAARGLGAGSVRTFMTITLPLAYRGVIAGVLLGFVRALSEFGATIIVAGNIPGRTQTVPSAIFTRISSGDTDAAWRLALVSVVLGVVALAVHNWLLKRGSANGASNSNGRAR
jgi:molybdate transport system permease protein